MIKKFYALLAVLALALLGVMLTAPPMVSATPAFTPHHTPAAHADCSGIHASGNSYSASDKNWYAIILDGNVVVEQTYFGTSFTATYPVPADGVAHTWRVKIRTTADPDGTLHYGGNFPNADGTPGTVGPCGSVPTTPTTPPSSTTETTPTTPVFVPQTHTCYWLEGVGAGADSSTAFLNGPQTLINCDGGAGEIPCGRVVQVDNYVLDTPEKLAAYEALIASGTLSSSAGDGSFVVSWHFESGAACQTETSTTASTTSSTTSSTSSGTTAPETSATGSTPPSTESSTPSSETSTTSGSTSVSTTESTPTSNTTPPASSDSTTPTSTSSSDSSTPTTSAPSTSSSPVTTASPTSTGGTTPIGTTERPVPSTTISLIPPTSSSLASSVRTTPIKTQPSSSRSSTTSATRSSPTTSAASAVSSSRSSASSPSVPSPSSSSPTTTSQVVAGLAYTGVSGGVRLLAVWGAAILIVGLAVLGVTALTRRRRSS